MAVFLLRPGHVMLPKHGCQDPGGRRLGLATHRGRLLAPPPRAPVRTAAAGPEGLPEPLRGLAAGNLLEPVPADLAAAAFRFRFFDRAQSRPGGRADG